MAEDQTLAEAPSGLIFLCDSAAEKNGQRTQMEVTLEMKNMFSREFYASIVGQRFFS